MIGHGWLVDRDALCDRLLWGVPTTSLIYIKLTWLDINFKTPSRCDGGLDGYVRSDIVLHILFSRVL